MMRTRKGEKKKKLVGKRKREDAEPLTCDLDQDWTEPLEDGAKQHNLTVVNVRNILHEVITNEHVVAMMKAAITESQGLPPFVMPQFVDIPLEEEEDSSDEEYRPEEEDEDETAEESLLESDVESTASSPRGHKRMRAHYLLESQGEERMDRQQGAASHITAESVPMGPPPPPKIKYSPDSAFMDKLHAVDEELDNYPVTIGSFQSLGENLIACRTRSKRPLKDVPIGQLEAELQAPDITPDMYEANTADDDNWKNWLRGLMHDDVGNYDEADDDDDPEYNILEDWDEPDTEDLRNDRAVRITKKEVNELMEELFETDEMGISHLEDEGADDEDSNTEPLLDFNTPQAIRLEEALLTEQHRTVRAQLEYLRMRKSLMRIEEEKLPARDVQPPTSAPAPKLSPVMRLNCTQRKRLQQQMQQHVQLLTQIHLLSFRNPKLCTEAETSQIYLAELSTFADNSSLRHGVVTPNFQSLFQACNLKDALQLIPLVHSQVPEDIEPTNPSRKTANDVPRGLSQRTAWILATRSVFLYPELLPVCSMKPRRPQDRVFFTKAEDCLLALGLKHFENIDYSKQLISKYLLSAKTAQQLSSRIKNLTMKKTPDNIIKFYKRTKMLPALGRCCEDILPDDARPPVEREKQRLPFWIKANLSSIETEMKKSSGSEYPLLLPPEILLTLKPLPKRFYWKSWRQKRSTLKPLLIRPNPVPNKW
ncbi:unnamed protein product [Ranitomeya imitator]|uniref:Uncharacterized protein n=1 Tax=Ranitomeya imitator TaxID=111125 RepID=A0ABN9L1D9_9NEOB|nr:unnamed protein product [Ranitomeya imitator]